MIKNLTWYNDDEEEISVDFPARHEVCHDCDGHGTHLRTSIRNHAYTSEEFNESFDDEGRKEYFRHGGMYDQTCETCKGLRVIPVVAEDQLSTEQKAQFEEYLEYFKEIEREREYDRQTTFAENGYQY